MKSRIALFALVSLVAVVPAQALNLSLYNPGTAGVTTFSWSTSFDAQLNKNVINIYEVWTNNNFSFVQFDGLPIGEEYVVRKHVTNHTGAAWSSFGNELLDPAGQLEDALDPNNQPSWVPSGYTTSNDIDGLSFGQVLPSQEPVVPRLSEQFASLIADEDTDNRDYLIFTDGLVANNGTDVMQFGLRDRKHDQYYNNQPFLLAQKTNYLTPEIPEPATLLLVGGGLLGGALARRRRRTA